MTEEIEVKIRNHKDEPVKVIVKENLYRWTNWKIVAQHAALRQAGRAHHPLPDHRAGGQGGDRALHGSVYVVEAALRLCFSSGIEACTNTPFALSLRLRRCASYAQDERD